MNCAHDRMYTKPIKELWDSRWQNIKFKVFRYFCDFWLYYQV